MSEVKVSSCYLEDELVKQLIAFEPIFSKNDVSLHWNFTSCSKLSVDADAIMALFHTVISMVSEKQAITQYLYLQSEHFDGETVLTFDIHIHHQVQQLLEQEFIGLSKLLKGKVYFQNEGKSFKVELHVPAENQQSPASDSALRQIKEKKLLGLGKLNSNSYRYKPVVLIIEPNEIIRSFLTLLLEDDYKVIEAISTDDGIHAAKKAQPDVILSECLFNDEIHSGFIAELHGSTETSHAALIVLSGVKDNDTKFSVLNAGAIDFIEKPFDAAELLLKIRNLCQQRLQLIDKSNGVLLIERLEGKIKEQDSQFFNKAIEIILSNYTNPYFDMPELAALLSVSERQLQRKFKSIEGATPSRFIRSFRLKKARKLLIEGKSVSTVADLVGFSSLSYFSTSFKNEWGYSPLEILQMKHRFQSETV